MEAEGASLAALSPLLQPFMTRSGMSCRCTQAAAVTCLHPFMTSLKMPRRWAKADGCTTFRKKLLDRIGT